MKKLLSLFVALFATTALWAGNVITYTASSQLSGYDGSLAVGATTFGPAITSHTFNNGTGTITCSGEITTIGDNAFLFCSGLTSVTIPNSVTTIGRGAFEWCSGLTSVTIPSSVTTIGNDAFSNCSSLTSVTIGNSVTTIGDRAFSNCSGLTSITIPSSVTKIGDGAFSSSGLTSPVCNANCFAYMPSSYKGAYTIPDGIKQIAGFAFSNCSGLTSITIPSSVTKIGDGAFSGSGLTSINVAAGNTHYASIDGVLFNYAKDTLLQYPIGNIRTTYTIPSSVTTIEHDAFYECYGLTSITIPSSVITIGYSAFSNCSSLNSVTIPTSVTTIESMVFYNCSGLTSITIPNSVITIEDNAFSDCSSLTSLTIGNSVTTIGWQAFYGCSALTSITIPSSVTTIGESAFLDCSGLTSVTIGNSVTTIGDWAFRRCSGLTSVTIPNSVTTIGKCAFFECSSLTSITIPNSVTLIGDGAFFDCSSLTSATCYAIISPTCGSTCFYNVDKSIPLYVPAQSVDAYKQASIWKDFTNILPIGAEEVPVTEPVATTDNNSVTITWPQTDNADTYTIEIKKGVDLACTLMFNAQGIMTNITFAVPTRGGERTLSNAEMTGNGYRFTVTGLETGTDYTYAVTVKDVSQQILETYSGVFTTTGGISTDINELAIDNAQCTMRKFIRNNRLQIMHNGKLYNAAGIRMR